MPFTLKSLDIDEKNLINMQGEEGDFYISSAGGKPELENCFFYGDSRYQFFFYAKLISINKDDYDIEIFTASVKRLSGPPPKIENQYLPLIEQNIIKFFRERQFHLPTRPINSANQARKICFKWRVVQ